MQYSDYQGEKISRLGFGLMRLPVIDDDQSKIDIEKVREMVHYAVDNGVNYFDTAYVYHNGFSEKAIGQIMKEDGLRDKINIATKMFTFGIDNPDFDPRKMLDEQLERLQTDHIDFYLLHGLQGNMWATLRDKLNIVKYMNDLKEQGVLRHIGFSFHDEFDSFKMILDEFDGCDFAQIQYNYVDHEIQAGDKGIAYAKEKGVPLVIMEPIKGGSLIFPDYPEIDEIKAKYGLGQLSNAELALDYVFDKEGILTVLSGMGNMDMLTENVAIADRSSIGMMDEKRAKVIEEIIKLLENTEHIDCTGCRYCVDGCPQNIAIPSAFRFYNEGKKYRNPDSQKRMYNRTCANIADCVECGACSNICPQHLDIPELLKEVRAYLG